LKKLTLYIVYFWIPVLAYAQSDQYHTRPSCWDETRMYHQVRMSNYVPKLKPTREKNLKLTEPLSNSPNNIYAYSIINDPINKTKSLLIFNERTYLIKLDLLDNDPHYEPEIKWINEKMIFIRVWIGQIMGYDVIFDVEKEEILSTDTFIYGKIDYQQWQAGCQNPSFKDDAFCQKECIDIENFKEN